MLWKGSQVPQEEDEEEAVTKKAIKELEIFVLQIFCNFFLFIFFFNYFTLSLFFYTFFTHDIYPHPHPQPTPTTHELYPRPTTHDPRHLATLEERASHYYKGDESLQELVNDKNFYCFPTKNGGLILTPLSPSVLRFKGI